MNLTKILKSVGKKDASKYSIEPCVLLRCKDTAQDSNGEEIKPAQDISKACGLSVYKVNPAYKPRASRCFADLLDDLEEEAMEAQPELELEELSSDGVAEEVREENIEVAS